MRIVDADEGRALNRDYRGSDYATNVLTFDYSARRWSSPTWCCARRCCAREARDAAASPLEAHYAHLLVHGTLHAQGFDHEDEADAPAHGGARSGADARARLRGPLRGLSRPRGTRAPAAAPSAIATSIRPIAAKSCQCSTSPSHHAPDSTPSTGISITDSVEAIGGRLRASTSQTGCAKPKISTAL